MASRDSRRTIIKEYDEVAIHENIASIFTWQRSAAAVWLTGVAPIILKRGIGNMLLTGLKPLRFFGLSMSYIAVNTHLFQLLFYFR